MGSDIDTPTWRTLYKIGGIAALLAAVLFRRNIGAEVSLFTGVEAIPMAAGGLFWMIWHLLVGLRLLQLSKE